MKTILTFCLGFLLVHPALAIQFQCGNNITISKPVYGNLYVAGTNIIINAPVHGDLIVAGGTITINDTVTKDILVAGGNVTLNGYVGDDVRCVGGKLHILKDIAGDLVISGGTITIDKAVTVGSILANGGEVIIDGTATGDIKATAGNFTLNGVAMKAINCKGNQITINGVVYGPAVIAARDKIRIGEEARFGNTVRYWASERWVNFNQSLKGGKGIYDPLLRGNYDRWYFLGFASVVGLLWYVGMVLLFIMIVQYLFSATMKKAGETAYSAALKSMGYGFLFWIGVPVSAVITFITVIGVPVGLILLFSYIILLLSATVITAVVAANWLNNRSNTNWNFWRMVFAALGIFVLLKVLTFTPFLGWFILILLVCISFGAIVLNINWHRKKPVIVQ